MNRARSPCPGAASFAHTNHPAPISGAPREGLAAAVVLIGNLFIFSPSDLASPLQDTVLSSSATLCSRARFGQGHHE
jgi:hypothetical protein